MEKIFLWVFVFVLLIGMVSTSSSWNNINNNSGSLKNQSIVVHSNNTSAHIVFQKESRGGIIWTINFYIALALILLIIIIIVVFIWLWIRGSKNTWN